MPQLDIVNIVTFISVICIFFYVIIIYFLGKLKTFLIFTYNVLLKDKNMDQVSIIAIYWQKIALIKSFFLKTFFN